MITVESVAKNFGGIRAVDAPLNWNKDGPDVLGDVLDQKTFQ